MATDNYKIVIDVDSKDAEKNVSKMEGVFGGLKKAGLALGAGLAAAGVAGIALGKQMLDAAADMESTKIGFTTLLGSAEKAGDFLKELQHFGATTPFEFNGLVSSSQQLLNMGFKAKEVIPLLTRVGDAVAAAGGDPVKMESTIRALTQIQAKGKLSAEEMMQLAEAGTFSWNALATTLGVTTAEAMKMASQGRISSQQAIDAFMSNSEERFGGLMSKQSESFSGLMSNLQDAWDGFLRSQGAVLLEWAKEFVKWLTVIVTDWLPKVVDGIGKFIDQVKAALPELGTMGETAVSVKDKALAMAAAFEKNTGLGAQLKQIFADLWARIQTSLVPAFEKLWVAMQPLMPYFEALGKLLAASFILTLKILLEVLAAIAGWLIEIVAKIIEFSAEVLNSMKPAIELITAVFQKLGDIIMWVVEKFNAMKEAALAALAAARSAVASVPGVGALVGGNRADGGPVSSGTPYIVGERGPEMFVPRSSGTIVPNNEMGGRVSIMEGANISVRNDSDIQSIANAVASQLARTLEAQRSGLATAS